MTAFDITGILSSKEFIAIYVAAAGVAVSIITYWYQKKEFRLKSLTEALSRLNDVKHKEARKVLYGSGTLASFEILGFNRPTPDGGASPDDLMTLSKDMVRSDFNEVATLIYHKLLDKKIFVREYSWIILRIWGLLEQDIRTRRENIGPSDYMKNFEELKEMAWILHSCYVFLCSSFAKPHLSSHSLLFYPNQLSNELGELLRCINDLIQIWIHETKYHMVNSYLL